MQKNSGDHEGRGSLNPVALIFSAVWGLNQTSTTPKILAPQEMVSLYALCVSLGSR